MYSPAQFGKLIGKSVKTLQRWDIDKTLIAHRDNVEFNIYINLKKAQVIDLSEAELNELKGFFAFRQLKLNTGTEFKIDHYGPPSQLL